MKKKNIVRVTAFILTVLMCLTCTATLFAEDIDATEVSSETKKTESVTETQESKETEAVSPGNAQKKRSELGQKILDFKNPDKYKDVSLFYGSFYSSSDDYKFKEIDYIGNFDTKIGLYNISTDTILFVSRLTEIVEMPTDPVTTSSTFKDSIDDVIVFSGTDKDFNPLNVIATNETFKSVFDNQSDYFICLFDKDTNNSSLLDNLLFTCTIEDSKNYYKSLNSSNEDKIDNNSKIEVSVTPITSDNNSVTVANIEFTYDIVDMYDYTDSSWDNALYGVENRTNEIRDIILYTEDGNMLSTTFVDGINTGTLKKGTVVIPLSTGINGTYKFKVETTLPAKYPNDTTILGNFDVSCFKSGDSTVLTDEELAQPTVSFSGQPSEAYNDDLVTFKMNTDKKCKMEFNGIILANNEYSTSADVSITSNGIYHYVAITEQGVKTEGDLEVNFFKERENTQVSDPLDTDLVSAKTDTSLSQTGIYQIWLIILAVVLCGIGITLILNQKYHFLDNIVRRLKHESN